MRDKRRDINLSRLYQTENLGTIASIHSTGLESQILTIHIGQRKYLRIIIKRHNRNHRIGTGTFPRQAESVSGSCHFQHDISASVIAVTKYKLLTLFRLRHQYIRIMFTDKPNSFRGLFTNNDTLRFLQHHAKQSTYPRRTCSYDKNRILPGNLRNACRPKSRSQHITYKKRLFIVHRIGNAVQSPVGIRNPDILRLAAVNTAS